MKKRLLATVGAGLLLVLGACGNGDSGEASADGEVYELNVTNFQPSTHHYVYNVFEPWEEYVEEKTDGRVQVNLYHGGTLGKSTSVLEDVTGGIAELGVVISTYYYDTEFFPMTIGNLPFAFEDSISGSKVMTKFGEKHIQDAFEDVHYLGGSYVTDPYKLFSVKPVRSIDDIKGLKMRVQGKSDIPVVEAWKGVPVSVSLDETYESLQKGTLDTAFYSSIGVIGHKYYEVAPYMLDLGTTVTPVTPVMNKNFYDSLPEDLQKMFDEDFGPKLSEMLAETHQKELETAHKELAGLIKGKGEIITLEPEEKEKFLATAESIWADWVEEANAQGYDGDQMMEDFKAILQEEGVKLPF